MRERKQFLWSFLLLILFFPSTTQAQSENSLVNRIDIQFGYSINALQYSGIATEWENTEAAYTIGVGYQRLAAKKTYWAFNVSRSYVSVNKDAKEFESLTFDPSSATRVTSYLGGFKTFVGEEITFFFMPQFGIVQVNYQGLEAFNAQQGLVIRDYPGKTYDFAFTFALGSDMMLTNRIILSFMTQYVLGGKGLGFTVPLYQSFNNSIGFGCRF